MLRRYLSLASLALAFAAGTAHALPDHNHPGTACRPNNGDLGKIGYTDSKGAENNSTSSTATVYCSVDHTFTGFTRPTSFQVQVIDRNGSAGVSCSLRGTISDGSGVVTYSGATSSSLNSATPQTLSFTLPASMSPNQRNYYTLTCTLPAATGSGRSSVVGYKLLTGT